MDLVYFICGLIIGGVLVYMNFRGKSKPIGILRIDSSDTVDGPYMFLELHEELPEFKNRKNVSFTVVNKDYLTRNVQERKES